MSRFFGEVSSAHAGVYGWSARSRYCGNACVARAYGARVRSDVHHAVHEDTIAVVAEETG